MQLMQSISRATLAERASDNEQRLFMADPKKFCIFQTSENTGLRIMSAVEQGGILAVFSREQIKSLYHGLLDGTIRSNRMFLYQHPSTSVKIKQHLKLRSLNLSDERIFELLRSIEEVTGVGARIKTGEIHLLDFVFDVMLPETLIKILEEEGRTRLLAEMMMASGTLF